MDEITKKLRKPLSIDQVEFRVQSVSTKGYVTLLAFKTARTDMDRLDEVFGVMGWQRRHTRDNHNCIISIWDEKNKQWVEKEDTGTESFSDKEKGLASDSFKRAGFNWSIGRELYNYPKMFLQLYPDEFKLVKKKTPQGEKEIAQTTFAFDLDKWTWELDITDDGKVTSLVGKDGKGRLRYDSRREFNGIPKDNNQQPSNPPQQQTAKPQQQPKKEPANKTVSGKPKMSDEVFQQAMKSVKIDVLTKALTKYDLTNDQMGNISLRIEELKEKQNV